MKALLLAGGLGTRLRPLTYTRPKHLLPVANRPHIEHVLELLRRHGIDGVVLLTSYRSEAFEETMQHAKARGMAVDLTYETEPLGTAGAIKNAQSFVGSETFVVFNGDILTDVDLGAVVAFHHERDAEATILLTPVEEPSAFGVVPTADDGRVQGFIEKPASGDAPTNAINAGVYVFEPQVLDRIPAGEAWSAEHQLFPGLVDDGARLFALGTDAYWMDIGTPQKYLQANLDALAGRYVTDATDGKTTNDVLADGANLSADAQLSCCCLGRGSVVDGGAEIVRSVLLEYASVGAGASVQDSIVGAGARVAPHAKVVDAAIADGDRVG